MVVSISVGHLVLLAAIISLLIVLFNHAYLYTLRYFTQPTKSQTFKNVDEYEQYVDKLQQRVNDHYEKLWELKNKNNKEK